MTENNSEASGSSKCDKCSNLRQNGAKSNTETSCEWCANVSAQTETLKSSGTEKNETNECKNAPEYSLRKNKREVTFVDDKLVTQNCDSQSQTVTDQVGNGDGTERMFNLVDLISDSNSVQDQVYSKTPLNK